MSGEKSSQSSHACSTHTHTHTHTPLPINRHEVVSDGFEWQHPITFQKIRGYLMLDGGSDFAHGRVVHVRDERDNLPDIGGDWLKNYWSTEWWTWMGRPKIMRYDAHGAHMSNQVREWLESQSIAVLPCAKDAHWQISRAENLVQHVKDQLDDLSRSSPRTTPAELLGRVLAAR